MNKTIVICSPGNSFPGKFLVSLTHLIKHLITKGFNVKFCTTYSRNIYEVRNKCLLGKPEDGEDQKLFDGLEYDYILWLDDDVIFSPSDFDKLYKEDKDVINLQSVDKYEFINNYDSVAQQEMGTYAQNVITHNI